MDYSILFFDFIFEIVAFSYEKDMRFRWVMERKGQAICLSVD